MRILQQLVGEGRWREAEARITQLRQRAPFDPQLLFTLSYVLNGQGRVADAIGALRQCLSASPRHVPALINMSVLLAQSGEIGQAIGFAQRAAQHQPRDPAVHAHLANVWSLARKTGNALEALDQAVRLAPRDPQLLANRMDALSILGRFEEAAAAARSLLTMPGHAHRLQAYITLLNAAAKRSAWGEQAELLGQLQATLAQGGATGAMTLMMSIDDPALLRRIASDGAIPGDLPARPVPRGGSGPVTIGYLSADIYEHPVAHMLVNLLGHHDPERFRVVLLSLVPTDGSSVGRRVRGCFAQEIDLCQLTDAAAAQAIRAAGVDVLVDLMGVMAMNRIGILMHRPCPVQVLWLGCPVTTGHRVHEAFLVDRQVAPPGYDAFCSERLIRLPVCYHPITLGEPPGRSTLDRAQAGLPDDAVVIGLFQQPDRIRPPFIEQLAKTLAPHPHAHLWLRAVAGSRQQVVDQLGHWGIPPQRIHFLERYADRADYLKAQQLADVLVDSHPYGGHSTTGEALSLGVPVLCRAGSSIHARVAASMLHELGLGDLVARSEDEQMQRLTELLTDPAMRLHWKERFAQAAAQPAEPRHRRLVAALEQAYADLLQQAAAEAQIAG